MNYDCLGYENSRLYIKNDKVVEVDDYFRRNLWGKREIYLYNLSPVVSEQGGVRPVIIVQNNIGNKYSLLIIIAL